ncbi:hypothetical protein [Shouchella lehensis]|uniref:hypothetical protein n=1 Tax=Shouchella lehensis TaxID=300825 RepID=UPI00141980E5|nr:hypothetical protein [Shouchella lehensis]
MEQLVMSSIPLPMKALGYAKGTHLRRRSPMAWCEERFNASGQYDQYKKQLEERLHL